MSPDPLLAVFLLFFVFVFVCGVNDLLQVETILFRVHDKVVKDPGAVTADNVLKVRAWSGFD